MKKLFTLLTALLCFSMASNAQRLLDVEAKLVSLTPNKVGLNEDFEIKAYYKNAGTSATKITDTVVYWYTYNNALINLNGGTYFFRTTQKALNPGDTTQIIRSIHWTGYPEAPADSTKDFCFYASIMNSSPDSSRDNNPANGSSCLPLTRKAIFPAGIVTGNHAADRLETNTLISTYPNPVQNEATFNMDLKNNADVIIRVYDLTGKLVIDEHKGTMPKGTHAVKVSTQTLQSGIYIYVVGMGDNTASDKLVISKQ